MGSMKMAKKKNSAVARTAWNILRLALLGARKGGLFKRCLMTELCLLPKFAKSLGCHVRASPGDDIRLRYGYGYAAECQLSFDKTPVFPSVKFNGSSSSTWFFNIPCLIARTKTVSFVRLRVV